ncbi:RDD family protein [Pseudohalocynthiibacter aestuariivivens]|jgi:uncharacterized RDD family membrane protein YckC|uniref:RDD family protein n=1 Tax=Pseudohalocynthiibacter aestuariivivens TaxID=1591409 RepID=A0ABV5JFP4_9RHOB|nr:MULTISPECIES: RDD family protein [Pseudohalocynthiibacter]MBS9716381.1 RDD family protein [Pseudohalocynthiibacter aestuariivivens]MCK0100810.1 RDD family protein [Pseudohalocynthiibacter sp. F2068]
MQTTHTAWGLPDPDREAEFYQDVPTKRLIAWVIDTILTALITALIVVLGVFIPLLILPLVFLTVNFIYRTVSLSRNSATPGMRLAAIEFRTNNGERFDLSMALLHTAGFLFSVSLVFPQVISVILMLTGARAQGLTDLVLGCAAINRSARF